MRRAALLLLLLPLAALPGCAGGPSWVNPALPKERWDADLTACRRDAEDELGPGAYSEPGDERSANPMKMADRARVGKRFDALVASCMRDKGYRPAK